VALIALAATCFASMDSTTAYTGRVVPVLLILWTRYGLQAVVMALWLLLRHPRGLLTRQPGFQALRGALLLFCSSMSFYGVQHLPVAEFTAIIMLTPVLVTLLAGWWLHEPVTRTRWALVGGCFIGALIVIRPGSGLFGWGVLFPLVGAVAYAAYQVVTRRMAHAEAVSTTHFYTGFVGFTLLAPVLWASPLQAADVAALPARQLALLATIGTLGTVGHLLLILALGMARTSTLMPFIYLQIPVAALAGALLFGHVPDAPAWAGMAVIAACGAASVWLNVREARTPVAPVAAEPTPE
jgi:drug/metabolite transporter (DMT)-like permease